MKKIHISIVLIVLLFGSCNDDFMNLQNPSSNNSDTYFTTAGTLTESVNAIYQVMNVEPLWARSWFFMMDLVGNEGESLPQCGGEFKEFYLAAYDGTNPKINDSWRMLYRMVTRANFALEKLAVWQPNLQEEINLKTRLQGESEFLLAFAYFYISNLWGDVPLRKTFSETAENINVKRTPKVEVFKFAEEKLLSAISKLPSRHEAKQNGRATKWSAKALLAKFYMQEGRYTEAEPLLVDINTNGGFSMNPGIDGFAKQFLKENRTSPETIFDVKYLINNDGDIFFIFWGGDEYSGCSTATCARAQEYSFNGGWFNVCPNLNLVRKFSNSNGKIDPRGALTFYGDAKSGGDTTWYGKNEQHKIYKPGEVPFDFESIGYAWKKYGEEDISNQQGQPNSEISAQLIRLADIKLLLAECYIMNGQNIKALNLINEVRARVGAELYGSMASSKDAGMEILKLERELELSGEQHRWFDLLRWHNNWNGFNMIEVLNEEKVAVGSSPNFQQKHLLYPIPQSEKDVNKLCEVPNGWN